MQLPSFASYCRSVCDDGYAGNCDARHDARKRGIGDVHPFFGLLAFDAPEMN
jgi:hypothetical protein